MEAAGVPSVPSAASCELPNSKEQSRKRERKATVDVGELSPSRVSEQGLTEGWRILQTKRQTGKFGGRIEFTCVSSPPTTHARQ